MLLSEHNGQVFTMLALQRCNCMPDLSLAASTWSQTALDASLGILLLCVSWIALG